MHTLLPYHRGDYRQLPDEDKLLTALRAAGLNRGLYIFPFGTHQDMKSAALREKYQQGPVGMMTIFPSGLPVMPKFLSLWFAYCLIVGIVVAYLTGRTGRVCHLLCRAHHRRRPEELSSGVRRLH